MMNWVEGTAVRVKVPVGAATVWKREASLERKLELAWNVAWMMWLPTARVEVVKVAIPLVLRGAESRRVECKGVFLL